MTQQNGNDQTQQEREKFVLAFNDTMLKIWKEQMTLLGVIDTGRLLHSPKSLPVRADGRFIELGLSQTFLEYGLWQNFGTGKEIPRGNHGDIGRERKRSQRRNTGRFLGKRFVGRGRCCSALILSSLI